MVKEERKSSSGIISPAPQDEGVQSPVSPTRKRSMMVEEAPKLEPEFDAPTESKISKTLSDKTIKTVIILILTMLFLMPLFQIETFFSAETSFAIGLETLVTSYNSLSSSDYQMTYDRYLDFHDNLENPLIYLQAPGNSLWTKNPDVTDLRLDEYETKQLFANDGSEFFNTKHSKV